MNGKCHGTPYPLADLEGAHRELSKRNLRPPAAPRGLRQWVVRAGCAPATVARWTTRSAWLADLGEWSRGPGFAAAKAQTRVSITAATLLAIAAVMAEYADHDSGRHVAIVRARIAEQVGCSIDTVSVAWRLLRLTGWALEVQRGHGGPTTPAGGRRPSIYHLIPQRTPQPSPAENTEGVHNPDLPPKAGSSSSSPVGTSSPSAPTRRKSATPTTAGRRWRAAPRPQRPPRPLPLQRLAAQLAARCHGLHRGHIGAIADVLTAAGIDPAVWSARAITDALEADMRARGWSWPDRIAHPAAFLASRLRRVDWRTCGPLTDGGVTAAGPDTNAASEPPSPTAPTALGTGRAALGGAGHTAARAAAQAATLRALVRRTAAAAAETAARDAAIHAARGLQPLRGHQPPRCVELGRAGTAGRASPTARTMSTTR